MKAACDNLTNHQFQRRNSRLVFVWSAMAVALALFQSGCTTYKDYDVFVKNPAPLVTATEYRMAPPDVVLVSSKRVREINGHTEQLRTDGKITLPLLGSVMLAGRTPEEAAAELQNMAREFYQDADVSVRVVSYNSKRIYIWGQVSQTGPVPYNGANTIYRTLATAQPTPLADFERVEILRPNRDGKLVKRMTINLKQMIEEGNLEHDAVLEEGDVINVPPNMLAAVGLAFQQLLFPIQPAANTVKGPSDIYEAGTGAKAYGDSGTSRGIAN